MWGWPSRTPAAPQPPAQNLNQVPVRNPAPPPQQGYPVQVPQELQQNGMVAPPGVWKQGVVAQQGMDNSGGSWRLVGIQQHVAQDANRTLSGSSPGGCQGGVEHVIWGSVEQDVLSNSSSAGAWSDANTSFEDASLKSSQRERRMEHHKDRAQQKPHRVVAFEGQVVFKKASSSGGSEGSDDYTFKDEQPPPDRKPEWSQGANDHAAKRCKPCAWHWKPSGCSNGQSCNFCHTCEAGQLKLRKQQKIQRLKSGSWRGPSDSKADASRPGPGKLVSL